MTIALWRLVVSLDPLPRVEVVRRLLQPPPPRVHWLRKVTQWLAWMK